MIFKMIHNTLKHIEKEFNTKIAEINELRHKIEKEAHEKKHAEKQIIHIERGIRELEAKLLRLNKSEKHIKQEEHIHSNKIEHYNTRIRGLLKNLDSIRKQIR